MKFDEWLTSLPIQSTPNGVRLDLRLYIYPDGHGNFLVEDENGKARTPGQPVNDSGEARDVLEKIWNRAMGAKEKPAPSPRRNTLAERLGDLIGSVPELPADMAEHHDHYLHGAPKE
ncbi:MAG TPA: hypothetical protein VJ783_29055 [Pirellulales bacterium]|nr:hypothetical protein [Pirellulales bacterium]